MDDRSLTVDCLAGGETAGSPYAAWRARGRAAFPALDVDEAGFARYLDGILEARAQRSGEMEDRAVEDLYLAYACISGVEGAVAAFEATCASAIRAALSGATASVAERDEIEQQLRTELLVGSPRSAAKIRSYRGEATLARFAAVAARRMAISMSRTKQVEARARQAMSVGSVLTWSDPAIAMAKERYRDQFRCALEDAIGLLAPRERLLLRLHLVEGATTRKIAQMYHVSQPTASRWVESARQHVGAETERLLRKRLHLTPAEIRSLARLIQSQLELSLSGLLGQS